jgi:H+/Cl- antiporter ClcA
MLSLLRARLRPTLLLLSPRLWGRNLATWLGAIAVALVALGFARAADAAQDLFAWLLAGRPLGILLLAPAGLALSAWLTRRVFPGAQGSGIPQTMAALKLADPGMVNVVLSLRIAAGKILLTLLGLAAGASIGREGPTVQVGAAMMHTLGRRIAPRRLDLQRGLILAGGAAGIAAAFNTPLAGVVFAIEELSHSFESRTSGVVLTAVILAGITTLALAGNYTYFGATQAELDLGAGWIAVALCALSGGLAGGAFSATLVAASRGLPGRAGRLLMRHPVGFAALCGLALALLGLASDGATFGTGYAQARGLVERTASLPPLFALEKLLATLISYLSGIPGGIFAPSLAVGAGIGEWLAHLVPRAPEGAVVLLGMVAYFAGVVQAPITATVIVMEMTDNQRMTIPLLATAMLAFGVSRLICRHPLYSALALRFLAAVQRAPALVARKPILPAPPRR